MTFAAAGSDFGTSTTEILSWAFFGSVPESQFVRPAPMSYDET